ncbi:hypothetical protein J1N35_025376 [Gossypium stocksii]|uniref:Retrotransposon Copia-like N-terminal domain-containing protein n=1 Tax=Gossypium stocksii TaxID=47602 RepID=A0A9D3V8W6_9ROSI|nr:hypothetical protein J1N35_025376 [Gossypium stocksii]
MVSGPRRVGRQRLGLHIVQFVVGALITHRLLDSLRLIQSFPRHDTVKLDEKNFVQWQQHVRLITEGYELLGFLEGTLPAPPRFVASSNVVLTPNPDASVFI